MPLIACLWHFTGSAYFKKFSQYQFPAISLSYFSVSHNVPHGETELSQYNISRFVTFKILWCFFSASGSLPSTSAADDSVASNSSKLAIDLQIAGCLLIAHYENSYL